MFADFANLWVPVCREAEVAAYRPTALVVAGEPIVLFRNATGQARALIDRCPHRGVALSLGRIVAGQIVCPFHGWQFDGTGACQHVPWNPDARREPLSATALPLRTEAGLIWMYTGLDPAEGPHIPASLLAPKLRLTSQTFLWQVHWTRVMENMLDTPHLPFVHAGTIGRSLQGRTGAAMSMVWEPNAHGATIIATRAGEAPRTNLSYHFPSTMELAIDPGGRLLRLLAVCLPGEAGQTRLTIYTLRNFARSRLFDPLFAWANARIAREDKAIIESSVPSEVPAAGQERSVPTDAPTLAFRKLWFTRIRDRSEGP